MKNKGQIWIETVTYTLVAFILIGLILAFVKPKIDELQDKALIDQSLNLLKKIDQVIGEVYDKGVGNKRMVDVLIRKGELSINSTNYTISLYFEGEYEYSEVGQIIQEGSFEILTTKVGSSYGVLMEKKYENYNITYSGREITKLIGKSPTPYKLFISNKGGGSQVIDFSIS